MIRTIVIAAAGKGTRMGELTKTQPKHLISVAGKPFLWYVVRNVFAAGFDDVIIVAGYFAEKIEAFARDFYPQCRVVNQFERVGENRYGSACTLMAAEEFITDKEFVLMYGDNLFSADDLARFRLSGDEHIIGGIHHDTPQHYGELIVDKDRLVRIIEKPKKPQGNIINTGVYKFTVEVFSFLPGLTPSLRGEYELTDVVSTLAARGRVRVLTLKDYFLDFGKPEDISRTEVFLREHHLLQ